jgi:hypothetical protein
LNLDPDAAFRHHGSGHRIWDQVANRFLGSKNPVVEDQPRDRGFDLKKRESHSDAISRTLTKSQEGVGTSFRFIFGRKIIRIENFGLAVELLFLHKHWAAKKSLIA